MGATVIVIECAEAVAADRPVIAAGMRLPRVVADGRDCFDATGSQSLGVCYHGVARLRT